MLKEAQLACEEAGRDYLRKNIDKLNNKDNYWQSVVFLDGFATKLTTKKYLKYQRSIKMQAVFYKYICLIAVMFLIMSSGCSTSEHPLQGEKAPDFVLDLLGGGTVSLADLKGKPVLLEFWAPWCPGCLDNIAPAKELHSRFADRVHVVAPSLEGGRNAVRVFVEKHKIPYPVIFANRKLLDDYMVSTIPVTVIIDKNGIIRHHHLGRITTESMSKKLEALL